MHPAYPGSVAAGLWPFRRCLRFLDAQERASDPPDDPCCGCLDQGWRQMRIPRGGLHLRVTEQLPDHREALAQGQRPRSMRVPEVGRR